MVSWKSENCKTETELMRWLKFSIIFLIFVGCKQPGQLSGAFTCDPSYDLTLALETDLKTKFQIGIPSNWKVNLYQDEVQSSIYVADTTVALSNSILMDVTWVKDNIKFDKVFLLKNEQEELFKKNIKVLSKEIEFQGKKAHYALYKGNKNNLPYQSLHFFIKIDEMSFLKVKIDVYGKEENQERLCKALSIIDQIKILEL